LIKLLIYPFFAFKVATEMAITSAGSEVRKALQHLVVDTLSDSKEINEIRAEIAVLRAEVNEVKYDNASGSGRARISVP
jgi:hypothetical protein